MRDVVSTRHPQCTGITSWRHCVPAVLFSYLTSIQGFIGSHLLGAFAAGMCFVNVPRSHAIWLLQTKRVIRWLVRIFFAASVGFAIPVREMAQPRSMWKGFLLGVGPVILTKIVSGIPAYTRFKTSKERRLAMRASWATRIFRMQPQQLLVGMAMVARGEFAYLVADVAQSSLFQGGPGMTMDEEVYAAVMWALVMATIFSPVAFRWALAVYERANPVQRSQTIQALRKPGGSVNQQTGKKHLIQQYSFGVRIAARHHTGVQKEILSCFHGLGVDVLETHVHAIDHTSSQSVDAFVASYHVRLFLSHARGILSTLGHATPRTWRTPRMCLLMSTSQ